MASVVYNYFKTNVMNGSTFDMDTNTVRVALVTSAYTADADAHTNFGNITGEVVGTGYTAGGEVLASVTLTQDDTDNEGVFDAADKSWTTATFTARGAIIYMDTAGAAATDPLICFVDFGSDYSVTASTFTITWASEGILNLT